MLRPHTEQVLGWRIGESGFRVVLGSELPAIACEALRDDVDRFLAPHGLGRDDVGLWLVHPGGPKVLRNIETALALPSGSLRYSWQGLRRLGNVSSAAVLWWMDHPNYAAVLGEGIALPLVHTAWITALAFTVANLTLLRLRIRVEDVALGRRAA